MKILLALLGALALSMISESVQACDTGLYRASDSTVAVAVTQRADVQRYMLTDGRRGEMGEAGSLVTCVGEHLRLGGTRLERVALAITHTQFESHGTALSGWLIEPPGVAAEAPLLVLVHGSERTSPITSAYPYIFAAYGLRVFAYDKRGTGSSEGEYTQNFELLADDAAAALKQARTIAQGRYGRIGFFGGSQGGWVAPLAATRSAPDFVSVGFGLVLSPLEEDREQVLREVRDAGGDEDDIAAAREITDATAALIQSGFREGYDALRAARDHSRNRAWFPHIRGEFTGDILAMSEADLRRIGRARFDNLELIWDYDGAATLSSLKVPVLWIIAEADREAPPKITLQRLDEIRQRGASIDIFSFPDTDHGMVEFQQQADGERVYGRITEGYFRLLTDWIHGDATSVYGRARRR